jgi:hypothetical protein
MYDDEYANCAKTSATLRIMGDGLEPALITQQLGIEPSWGWRKGELRPVRIKNSNKTTRQRIGIWGLDTDKVVKSRDLRRHIDWILERVNGKAHIFELLKSQGYEMDVYCIWHSAGQGGPMLSPQNIAGLANLGLELDIELYAADKNNYTD